MATIALADGLEPLRPLLGTWQGEGTGRYPTVDAFDYLEEVRFWHAGKPFVGYEQRTRHPSSGLAMHAESGYWRIAGVGPDAGSATVEAVIAHPSGLSEILVGTVSDGHIEVLTETVARTPTAKEVTVVRRSITVDDDTLTYELDMAAVGQPLQFHLAASLHRVAD